MVRATIELWHHRVVTGPSMFENATRRENRVPMVMRIWVLTKMGGITKFTKGVIASGEANCTGVPLILGNTRVCI